MKEKSNKQEKIKKIFNDIVEGVNNIITSGEYTKFLEFSRYFHNYSFL